MTAGQGDSSGPDHWSRRRFAEARVARLGTVGDDGVPHLVPCCFAVDGLDGLDVLDGIDGPNSHDALAVPVAYSAVDDKPKRSAHLRRLDNVGSHPVATLLVDHYEDDWSRLWWVRVDGPARLVDDDAERVRATRLLREKYPPYAGHRLDAAILAVELRHWRSWSAAAQP